MAPEDKVLKDIEDNKVVVLKDPKVSKDLQVVQQQQDIRVHKDHKVDKDPQDLLQILV